MGKLYIYGACAIAGLTVFSGLATLYGLHARNSAVLGWADATAIAAKLAVAQSALSQSNSALDEVRGELAKSNSVAQTLAREIDAVRSEIVQVQSAKLANTETELAATISQLSAETAKSAELKKHNNEYKVAFRAVLSKRAGIQDGDVPMTIAQKLTNHLHSRINQKAEFVETSNSALRYALTANRATANFCSSLSTALVWMLDQYGITGRSVHFAAKSFLNGQSLYDTHTMVEMQIGGDVVAIDPTFNTMYQCMGQHGYADARELGACNRMSQLKIVPIGKHVLDPANYYIPLTDIFYAVDSSEGDASFYKYSWPEDDWSRKTRAKFYRSTESAAVGPN